MGTMDLTGAERPTRNRVGGSDRDRAAKFSKRMPPSARRSVFIRNNILLPDREPPVNPNRAEIDDFATLTQDFKQLVLEMGADDVGVAQVMPELVFTQAGDLGHGSAVVYGMTMAYDYMADIGPNSQAEVHRVYHLLDELGVRLAQRIASFGYSARMQPNEGDVPLPALAYLAGIGELGKHGSMISPKLGSSFRLGCVTTDMPLKADGPGDFGLDEVCASCQLCTRFCPADAIKPDKITVNGITRWHVDTPACEPYFHKLYGCKICLMVCPINARGAFRGHYKELSRDLVKAKDGAGLLALIAERTDLRQDEFIDAP